MIIFSADATACYACVRACCKKSANPSRNLSLMKQYLPLANNPEFGEVKLGDSRGSRVYKVSFSNQLRMLTYHIYHIRNKNSLKLLVFGPHEHFHLYFKWKGK